MKGESMIIADKFEMKTLPNDCYAIYVNGTEIKTVKSVEIHLDASDKIPRVKLEFYLHSINEVVLHDADIEFEKACDSCEYREK